MKKILLSFILVLCLFITSCSKKLDNDLIPYDGIPFKFYTTFKSNDITYDLYKIDNPILYNDERLYEMFLINYRYVFIRKEITDNWIVNYQKEYRYILNEGYLDNILLNDIYYIILETLNEYKKILGINLELFQNNQIIDKEYVVDVSKKFEELYLIDLFIPYRVKNNNTDQTYIINVPMMTFLAYRNNNTIELIYDNDNIQIVDFQLFISSQNVINI